MNKTVFERVRGELIADDGRAHQVDLDLTIMEMYVDQEAERVKRTIDRHRLASRSSAHVPDGKYTLIYTFDGRQEQSKVRVNNDSLFVG